ncbi:VanZ family protein [Saccharopolyspora sp. HNM0983]|uniref:VanZ family protein n=1 Tax=Saccharopolyspora montiporae TaxID=2781240 RepID=A0A929B8G6_9PSEU|nr:VanZ family protein [Saccharopolyspora sp. HNM0983]MBE9374191.1 VanZ family protein [Saccharopolyspora sp. HNM0983]
MPRSLTPPVRALPFAAALLLSVIVLFTPASGVPSAPPGTDKVIHIALFAALALTGRAAGIRTRVLLPALAGYAIASELLQGRLPIGRSADAWDAAADLVGVAAGFAAHRVLSDAVRRSFRRGRRPSG